MLSLNRVKTTVAAGKRNHFDFGHHHMTTLDFGINRPVLMQECVPGDRVKLGMSVFSRLTPLALPTIGQAGIESRAFFVRTRLLFDSYQNWLTDTPYLSDSGAAVKPYVPLFRMFDICSWFVMSKYVSFFRISQSVGDWGSIIYPLIDYTIDLRQDAVLNDRKTGSPWSESEMSGYDGQFYFGGLDGVSGSKAFLRAVGYNYNGTFGPFESLFGYVRFKFTPEGKNVLNILRSLGYRIDFSATFPIFLSGVMDNVDEFPEFHQNALPFLSFARIFTDFYTNPRYTQVPYNALFVGNRQYLGAFYNGSGQNSVDSYNWKNPDSFAYMLWFLSQCQFVLVSPDVYNTSWLYPNSNIAGSAGSSQTLYTNPSDESTVISNYISTGALDGSEGADNVQGVSDVLLRSLNALSKWVRRNNVIGSRYVDRLLVRFGLRPSDAVVGRAEFLGSDYTPINIGDVTATANGSTADGVSSEVGDYNGKGSAFGGGLNVQYDCDEAGYLIVLSTIRPRTSYYEGADPTVLRSQDKFDWFTPEFDAVGMVPLDTRTMFGDVLGVDDSQDSVYDNIDNLVSTFGWLPTYSDYKYKHDKLTGDFAIPSLSTGLDSFHMMRKVEVGTSNNLSFQLFDTYLRQQYDRIFRDTSVQDEHFILSYVFKLDMQRPMLSITDSLVYPDEQGKKVSTPPSGQYF